MKDIRQAIIAAIKKETKLDDITLEVPPDQRLGDFAFPCFPLAKIMKKAPNKIAEELKDKLKVKDVEKIENNGPYLNLFIKKDSIIKGTIEKIEKEKGSYGSSNKGKGKKAFIEHTSINPNASPHVGRARNAIIGDFIVKLLKFEGYDTEVHYFVNDVGKQIAMLVLGSKDKKDIKFKDLLSLYVKINKKVEENPDIEKEVFGLLHKLEAQDKNIMERFRKIVDICIKGQTTILEEFGISYDHFDYESEYLWNKRTDEILKKFEKTKKLFEDEEKRLVLDLKDYKLAMKNPVLVLTRADKTSLYPLRDIAYTIDKIKKNDKKNIILLGEDQKLYFEQVKSALDILGYRSPEPVHYSFVLLTDGKMSTRKGAVVLLEDLMKETLDKAKKELKKRYDKAYEKRAKAIAYSAIKYSILKVAPEKNVIFDLDAALQFEGDTGPYLQYAYARISSILRKSKKHDSADPSLLKSQIELLVIKKMAEFPDMVSKARESFKPQVIANYLHELAQLFSNFYNECPVLKAKDDLKKARLRLIAAVKQVLSNGMMILGMDIIEEM